LEKAAAAAFLFDAAFQAPMPDNAATPSATNSNAATTRAPDR